VLRAIADPKTRLSIDVSGLPGSGSLENRVMSAVQRDSMGRGTPFDWELARVYESGRMSSINFFEEADALANPFTK